MGDAVEIEIDDKVVRVSNPDRVYFPDHGWTKLDLVEYYLAVGDGIVNALYERPCMLHRFPKGLAGDKVHTRALVRRREWMKLKTTVAASASLVHAVAATAAGA